MMTALDLVPGVAPETVVAVADGPDDAQPLLEESLVDEVGRDLVFDPHPDLVGVGERQGIYELAGKTALVRLFNMAPEQALVLVLLFHAMMVGFGALSGLVTRLASRFTLGQMREEIQQGEPDRSGGSSEGPASR